MISDDTQSVYSSTKIEAFDYEALRLKLHEYESEGHDLDALRLKIQNQARQLMDSEEV